MYYFQKFRLFIRDKKKSVSKKNRIKLFPKDYNFKGQFYSFKQFRGEKNSISHPGLPKHRSAAFTTKQKVGIKHPDKQKPESNILINI